MARKRRRRSDLDDIAYTPPADDVAPPPTPSRFFRRLVVLVILAAIVVALAPQIVCRTPLLGKLIAWGTADVQGTISVGQASLGWFSVPRVAHAELIDEAGVSLVRAAEVSGDRTLWQLLTQPTLLGRFRVERPEIRIVVEADGTTNLERVLAKFLEPQTTPTSTTAVDVAVQIVDGVLHVDDHATGRRWTIERFNSVVVVPSDPTAPLVGDVQGALQLPSGPARLSAQGSYRMATGPAGAPQPQGDAAATLEGLPLELIELAARRFVPGLRLTGLAQGDLRARFDLAAAQPIGDASGRLTLLNPVVGGAPLGGDELRLARLDVPLRVVIDGRRLQIDELTAACELASVDVRGSLNDFQRLANVTGLTDLLGLLIECDGRATARFDLARIGQSLPNLLNIRDDVQLTGGEVHATVQSDGRPGDRRQQLELTTSGLTALRAGQPIAWNEPLRATAVVRDLAGGPVVERIQCTSDFLTVDGVNAAESFELNAQYDLARLADRLAQFVDLGGLRLRGNGTARGMWLRQPAGRFDLEGQASINDFELSLPDSRWTEPQLVVGVEAVGRTGGTAIASLDSAAAGLQAGGDELTVRLAEPLADVADPNTVWPVNIVGKGDLATWLARVRPFAGLPPTAAAQGHVDLNAAARLRLPSDVELISSRLVAQPFRLAMYGMVVDEPTAELQVVGRYTPTETTIREATLTSPGLQSQVRQFVWRAATPTTPGQLGGDASVRAEVAKLVGLLGLVVPGGPQWGGTLEGGTRMQVVNGVTNAAVDAVVNNFSFAQPGGAAWREPTVKLSGTGVYDPAGDSVRFDRLELAAAALRVALAGRISSLSTARIIECSGEADYDLERLTPLAQSYLGSGVAFAGRETQRFELVGPLSDPARGGVVPWEKLNGAAKLGWQGANLYGFQLGRGAIDARLNQGVLRTSPLEVPVNTGRVRVVPSVRLAGGPSELVVDPGTIVDHVSITPEMANQRLMYVLPILAGVAQVGGQFSVALDELRLPLDNPANGAISGRMTVHSVDIGPGYILQEIATMLQQPLTASLTRESVVDFKMIQGRIYHQGLEFAFPEVKVRTHGSVGLDQTLSLVAEMPIPTKLLAGRPIAGAALSAQTVRIPIAGTLQRPALDKQAFAQATAQMIQSAAEGAVQEGLNRGLQRLFGPGALAPQPGTTTK